MSERTPNFQVSNADRDPETRTKAMNQLLREICRKFKEKGDPTFTQEELKKILGDGFLITWMRILEIY